MTRTKAAAEDRTLVSTLSRRDPFVRTLIGLFATLVIASLAVACAGPMAWLFKAATSTSTETLADPLSVWPSGLHWENFSIIWNQVDFAKYFLNTVWLMAGSLVFGLLVATTGGYWLAVLKPRGRGIVSALVLATLFIPSVVSLVALYMTVVDVPLLDISLINTFWAVWLPNAANAVGVLLVQRFFASIPGEIFEAAKVDGAGPVRLFVSIVLPMSRPILSVLSVLMLVGAYKEFLWPLLVLPSPDVQPIAVVLPRLAESTEYGPYMAALFISAIVPILFFLVFQRQFLRAAGNTGSLKG
ncbi:carbohydrate ABC transporter permease [Jiangella sp. DSM 45060]|uniref:carbohydrate ABC transporter permease n=1 Tax=Jiangella sp. DSM 45060 TaxID=1798224 RepID=UPI00087BAC2A|nr:carbohydrate ABC transporter permease [Jiangella sp. DSM 45060]SDS47372.1 multiple sugar transport system permease protein [Jiangella sp. DSM 45060]